MELTQAEADRLMRLEKVRLDDRQYVFPGPGEKLAIPLIARNGQERFMLDLHRGKRRVLKCTYQERYGGCFVLVRLDLTPSRHTNPTALYPPQGFEDYNGVEFTESHVHFYVEDYGDKWAIPASARGFIEPTDPSHLGENLTRFLDLCNVTGELEIIGVLE